MHVVFLFCQNLHPKISFFFVTNISKNNQYTLATVQKPHKSLNVIYLSPLYYYSSFLKHTTSVKIDYMLQVLII